MAGGSSSEPSEGPPSFFKVVRFPSAPHLFLPNAFVRSFSGKIPKKPILKTETGERSWSLRLKKTRGDYLFADGWDKVVKDAQLCIGDIVVFRLTDSFTFRVTFFDLQGCEKDLSSNNTSGGDEEVAATPDEDLYFQKQISLKTHKYSMGLPKKFVWAAGLENKKSILIKDDEGKEWIVGLMTERYDRTKHSLSAGWSLFRQYHELCDGDICLFKFLKEDNVLLLTQVIKSKVSRNQETPSGVSKIKIEEEAEEVVVVERKRGRPPREEPIGGSSEYVEVKTEVDMEPKLPEVQTDLVKRKRGRPCKYKPLEEEEVEAGRLFREKQVIFF